jgi:hypothetical protein
MWKGALINLLKTKYLPGVTEENPKLRYHVNHFLAEISEWKLINIKKQN